MTDLSHLSDAELNRLLAQTGPDAATAFGRGAGDALSFGWGDELMGVGAGVGAAVQGQDYQRAYNQQVAQSRSNLAQAQRQQPLATGAGELVGTGVGALIPIAGEIGTGARAARAASTLGRIGRAALTGGAMGALQGAGSADGDLTQRAIGAGVGGALGAGVGGAAHGLLGEALPALAQRGSRYLSATTGRPTVPGRMGAAEMAREDLMATARHANLNIRDERDLARVMASAAAEDPNLTTAEVLGQAGQGRLAALARARGRTGQAVEDWVEGRNAAQSGHVEDTLLHRAPSFGDNMEQELEREWRTRGNELYEPILSAPMSQEARAEFQRAIAPRLDQNSPRYSPTLAEAWNRAGQLIQEHVSLGNLPANEAQNLARRLHYTKLALDDMVKDPLAVPSGLRHVSNAQMAEIASNFADTLETGRGAAIIPGYRAARSELADIGTARRAITEGRQAFARNRFATPAALRRHMASLPDAQRPYFIAGVEDHLLAEIQRIGKDGNRNIAGALLTDANQARLHAIYGREADGMIARLRSLDRQYRFGQRVRPSAGSITSNIQLQIASGIGGAGLGAANVKDDPLMGALTGGAIGFGASALARRAASNAVVQAMERGAERQRDLLGRVYLTPVGDYNHMTGGLIGRAAREAQRRAYKAQLARTRQALLTGGLGGNAAAVAETR